jgi:hypothetical protein
MPVLYNSEAIVPAPIISISEQKQTAPDGTKLAPLFTLTLKGTLVAVPPGTSPVELPARLGVLLTKQKHLEQLFSKDGKILEIFSPDGTGVTKCNPVVKSIEFTEGIWVERTDYTIVLEAPSLYGDIDLGGDSGLVYEVSDNWQIEESGIAVDPTTANIKPVWQLTHTVSAKGRVVYNELGEIPEDESAWKQARDWVLKRLETSNFDGRPFDTKNELNLTASSGYNHTRTESVDIIDGSFSITETWILAYGIPALEDYTVQAKFTPQDQINVTVTVSGTIRGLSYDLNDKNGRVTNATSYFNTSVKNKLIDRARASVVGITLSDYGVTGSLDYNYNDGTIAYSYDFNDQPSGLGNDDVFEVYTISKKNSVDTVETNVTVTGTITGRLKPGEPNLNMLKFERAKAYWDIISNNGTLLIRANRSGVGNLKASPLDSSVDFGFFTGTVDYNYSFDNRSNDLARNEYTTTVRSSREDARTVVALEGSIQGLKRANDPPAAKYNNALAFWLTWEPQVFPKVSSFVPGVLLNPEPSTRSRGDNSYAGNISYNFEYDTSPIPILADSLIETISINDVNPADVYAAITVLGRKAGPILQDIGSKKERTRSVSLEIVMKPGKDRPTISDTDQIFDLYKPAATKIFVDQDNESWQPATLRYTRNINWIYEV